MLYIFDSSLVPLIGSDQLLMPHDAYFAVYNVFTLVADLGSRKLAYWVSPRNPVPFLLLSFIGAGLCFTQQGLLAPFGSFLIFAANGSIYGFSTKHIDHAVPKQYNLIALSTWLFLGDIGAVTGSNVLSYMRDLLCSTPGLYTCVPSSQ